LVSIFLWSCTSGSIHPSFGICPPTSSSGSAPVARPSYGSSIVPESWTSQKGPYTSFYCFLGSLASIFGTEEAQGARFRRARSPLARARWGRSKRRSRATLGCLSATEGGRRRAAHRSSARRRSATACGGAPVSGWRRGGHGRIQQGWGSGGARRRGTEARAHGLWRAAACRRRHGSGTSAETRGTRKNEESTSISASPSFDLSRWTKKTVAG